MRHAHPGAAFPVVRTGTTCDLNLNYSTATGSEKPILLNNLDMVTENKTKDVKDADGNTYTSAYTKTKVENRDKVLELDFGGNSIGGSSDLQDGLDSYGGSVDLVPAGACTTALYTERNTPMAFEMMFDLSIIEFETALADVKGVSFHLSPERGLAPVNSNPAPVPLPAAHPLFGGALSLLGFFGWCRKRMAAA